ncbi:hypothetical protein BU15DRAFT_85601 [Melanogaster broomeanus]|nr:hypothetical protein BU15DRAFT_85601 [Melanogaster broomeanus]
MDNSSVLSDEDYDVISNPGQRSLDMREIPPTEAARHILSTVSLSPADIQAWVRGAMDSAAGRSSSYPVDNMTVRVYVDGVFDVLTSGHMLQLRQAKLSFPSVYLMVGVFSDESCQDHGALPRFPHVERCEFLRHCRWADEIVPDAPWTLDDAFVLAKRIDYVALEEGSSVHPEFDKARMKGYDGLKKLGRVIPTQRTLGLVPAPLVVPPVPSPEGTPFRKATELEAEALEEGEGQLDVTHGINRLALDGQW